MAGCVHGGHVWLGGCVWPGGMCGQGVHGGGGVCGQGACVVGGAWQQGMHGWGCAWQRGGMCGGEAACVARGACVVGGVHGRGHAWGACVTCPPPGQILWLWHMVNERAVRILLECILVAIAKTHLIRGFG